MAAIKTAIDTKNSRENTVASMTLLPAIFCERTNADPTLKGLSKEVKVQ
jgi:hypothetical protein